MSKFCGECGAKNEKGASFCGSCGAKLENSNPVNNIPKKEHKQMDKIVFELNEKNLYKTLKTIEYNDEDAINMSRLLSRELGLGVGISSGANLIGSILLEDRIDGNVVTIFADDNKKYLSTDLLKSVDNNPDFISNQIELIDYEVII